MNVLMLFWSSLAEVWRKEKTFSFLFLITILFVFFYSFTQVDLSLTLSRASFITTLQRSFQYIGYFNRPLSTVLFFSMLILMSGMYLLLIRKILLSKLTRRNIWALFIFMSLAFSLSYNAFSHDIFNYIFDAKIVTHYFENPYARKALDYPSDPMLSFMHWTHRTYPYGPVWLGLSLPFSFLGLNYFLLTFFLFKFGITAAFIGMVYFIEKIMQKVAPERALLTVGLVAFHPLLILENLVTAHNDVAMMVFVFWGIYLLVAYRQIPAFLAWIISIGVKFATLFLFPAFVYYFHARRKEQKEMWNHFFIFSGCLMLIAVLFISQSSNFQPWYITWALPFFLLLPWNGYKKAAQVVGAFSAASLSVYVPYLFHGDWENSIPTNFFLILCEAITLFYLVVTCTSILRKR